jgi:hypothetical protein
MAQTPLNKKTPPPPPPPSMFYPFSPLPGARLRSRLIHERKPRSHVRCPPKLHYTPRKEMDTQAHRTGLKLLRVHCLVAFTSPQGHPPALATRPLPPYGHCLPPYQSSRGGLEHLTKQLVRAHAPRDVPALLPHRAARIGRGGPRCRPCWRANQHARRPARPTAQTEVPVHSLDGLWQLGCGEGVARYPRVRRDGRRGGLALAAGDGFESVVDDARGEPASRWVGGVAHGIVAAEAELRGGQREGRGEAEEWRVESIGRREGQAFNRDRHAGKAGLLPRPREHPQKRTKSERGLTAKVGLGKRGPKAAGEERRTCRRSSAICVRSCCSSARHRAAGLRRLTWQLNAGGGSSPPPGRAAAAMASHISWAAAVPVGPPSCAMRTCASPPHPSVPRTWSAATAPGC